MPTYGYECKTCGHTFDAFQSMSDEPLKVCPQCRKELRRLINGGTGVIFKGGGFYVTDKNRKSAKSGGAGTYAAASANAAEKSPKTDTSNSGVSGSSPCQSCAAKDAPACPKAAGS